jgi:hypothetical protein
MLPAKRAGARVDCPTAAQQRAVLKAQVWCVTHGSHLLLCNIQFILFAAILKTEFPHNIAIIQMATLD